jgi:predicted nucleotidyltransferase
MPNMGIIKSELSVRPFLFSKTRGSLIALLFGHTGNEYYVNQIMHIVDSGSGSVQRELRLMTEARLLNRTKRGNLVYYQANGRCPIFGELKSLADKGIFSSMATSSNLSGSDKRLLKCNPNIEIPRRKIAGFCRRHHIKKLSLFGSVLRDDFGPDSDVDVLVEFLPGHTPGYFSLFDMEAEFSALLGGRKADIRTSQDLSRYFREQVIREARVQYEAVG